MAIFGTDRTQQSQRNGSTIVAAGTQFVGSLTLSDTLHIDGSIEGDVQSESNVVIGADGYMKGQMRAAAVVVSGRVDGSISAERLEIVAGGSVEGDVYTIDLVIEPGGRFNGSSEILVTEKPAVTSPSKAEKTDKADKPNKAPAKAATKKPGTRPEDEVGEASTA